MKPESTPISIPFWEPQVGRTELDRIRQVMESNFLNDGEITRRFEERLAELLNVRHVVTTTSGTTALFAAIAAAGIESGDEVLVPDITFIATANAVEMAGATPVLVDVDPRTLTISPQAAERAITSRTRAIIPVHISGRAADMCALMQLAQARQLRVIEDACEALGSHYSEGRALGAIGDAGCFSFSPNKMIATGQGGAVVTSDDAFASRLRELKDQGRPCRGSGGDDVHVSVGFNLKFTNLQAAVGLGQLELLAARQKRLREIHRLYTKELANLDALEFPGFGKSEQPLWVDVLAHDRDRLEQHLLKSGIQGRRFWHPLHTQTPYRQSADAFPGAVSIANRAFWLPSSFLMRNDQVEQVCRAIKSFYSSASNRRAEAA